MVPSKLPMLGPCSMPGWREMRSAVSPIARSSEPCCGLPSSWWQETSNSGSSNRHSQHLEPSTLQQLPRTDKSPARKPFREALQIGSVETLPKRDLGRVHLHPDQIIHTHIRLSEHRLETVKQQTKLQVDIIWNHASQGVNANAPGKVEGVAYEHCVAEWQE